VRAIVVDNGKARAALIGADQSDMPSDTWKTASEQIAKELDCPVANILMSATHTHSEGAPLGPGTPAEQQKLAASIVQAVREAKGKLQPAQMAFGTGMAYLNVNRDEIDPTTHLWTQGPNPQAASDKTVAVLKFQSPDGKPIAVYVNYAMHPINGYLANFTTGDFAAAMSRYVEKNYRDQPVVIFSQGASGDQNPLYMHLSTDGMASRTGVPITGNVLTREPVEAPLRASDAQSKGMDPEVRERLEGWMQSEGQVIGEEVIRVMTNSTHTEENVRIWGDQTEVTCPGRVRTDQGREGMMGSYKDGPPVPLRLGVIGIGDVALTHIDAEVYTLIGQRVKRQSPLANTMFVTLANGKSSSGYIPDDASFGHLSFQVLGSHLKPGCAEDTIANTLADLVEKYEGQQP
jgi:neutral ceramidase